MCADGWYTEGKEVDTCEECGSPLNSEGEPIGEHCHYSRFVYRTCGSAPCDGSC